MSESKQDITEYTAPAAGKKELAQQIYTATQQYTAPPSAAQHQPSGTATMPRPGVCVLKNDLKPARHLAEQEYTYMDGEQFYVMGMPLLLKITYLDGTAETERVTVDGEYLCLYIKSIVSAVGRKRLVDNWYRALLLRQIEPAVYEICHRLEYAQPIKVRAMVNGMRWFTSNAAEGAIWLNQDLAMLDYKYMAYAAVSELVILNLRQDKAITNRELAAGYYQKMDALLPTWREWFAQLDGATAVEQLLPEKPAPDVADQNK